MRTYGVEIECVGPVSSGRVLRELSRVVNVREAAYSGRAYSVWQIKPDSTVYGDTADTRYGMEVVSPVLQWGNDDHVRQLRQVCETLAALGFTVNRRCGGHAHVYVGDLSQYSMHRFVRTLRDNVGAFDGLVRNGRQSNGNGNRWCAPLAPQSWDALINAAHTLAGTSPDDRRRSGISHATEHHYALNTQWYAERGTFEFRQRDGSVHWAKWLGYVGVLVALADSAANLYAVGSHATAEDLTRALELNGTLAADHARWALRVDVPTMGTPTHLGAGETVAPNADVAGLLERMARLQGYAVPRAHAVI